MAVRITGTKLVYVRIKLMRGDRTETYENISEDTTQIGRTEISKYSKENFKIERQGGLKL